MFEYLASAQSAVNRINYNMKQIKDVFGADSDIYQNYQVKIDTYFGENPEVVKGNYDGLRMPSKIFNDTDLNDRLEKLEQELPRVGDMKREYNKKKARHEREIKSIEEQHEDSPYWTKYQEGQADLFGIDVDFPTYVEVMSGLPDALAWLYDNKSDIEDNDYNSILNTLQGDTPGRAGSRGYMLSYSTLAGVLDTINTMRF